MKKEIEDLINIINQLNLIDIYRILHPIVEEYIFFSSTHGTFSTIDNILWPKSLKI